MEIKIENENLMHNVYISEPQEREHMCYECWRNYCKENNIEIIYDSIIAKI